MKYAVTLKDNTASIEISECLTSKELDVVKEMLIKAIDIRKEEIERMVGKEITRDDLIRSLFPPLTGRTQNILLRAGYKTVGDVLDSTISDLMRVRNMGKKSLEEIENRFSKYGNFKGEQERSEE